MSSCESFPSSTPFPRKIFARLERLTYGLAREWIDIRRLTDTICLSLAPGICASELDKLMAEVTAALTVDHPDYATLAGRVEVSRIHKETKKKFSAAVEDLYFNVNPVTGKAAQLVSTEFYNVVTANRSRINEEIQNHRDFTYSYFGIKTLEKSYLLSTSGDIVERPQYMLMRVAIGMHMTDLEAAFQTYHLMSQRLISHASPTLFNCGTPKPQLSSCFVLTIKGDSIEGIFDTIHDCAVISKHSGGIGLNIHDVGATGSYVSGANTGSNGIVPMLKTFDATASYVDQGENKRPGALAVYIEPWHADIFQFLDLKKHSGKEERRARNLFYALWIPDLFMKRVANDGDWHLFCPRKAPGLADVHGEAFEVLYNKYVAEGKASRTIPARKLWREILISQVETGGPFMLYKDSVNAKSNQGHIGTIKGGNLCTEVVQYTSTDETAVCTLGSIGLPAFVINDLFDFMRLHEVTKVLARNLDHIIDITLFPTKGSERSSCRHRPIGIGVQGLADVFMALRIPFESDAAHELNRDIFETIYHAAVETSIELAEVSGPYASYEGSPTHKGLLQFDLWGVTPSKRWDWDTLKTRIRKSGMRNALLCAPMPTASTSQIMGFNESFEPYTSNIYVRRVLSGEFQVSCSWLVHELVHLGLWTEKRKFDLLAANGSIQGMMDIPPHVREVFKTSWEISQRCMINMAAARGPYVCQSQSLNINLSEPTHGQLSSMHFYGWEQGLKTGMYYLRTQPRAQVIKYSIPPLMSPPSTPEGVTSSLADPPEEAAISSFTMINSPMDADFGTSITHPGPEGECASIVTMKGTPNEDERNSVYPQYPVMDFMTGTEDSSGCLSCSS